MLLNLSNKKQKTKLKELVTILYPLDWQRLEYQTMEVIDKIMWNPNANTGDVKWNSHSRRWWNRLRWKFSNYQTHYICKLQETHFGWRNGKMNTYIHMHTQMHIYAHTESPLYTHTHTALYIKIHKATGMNMLTVALLWKQQVIDNQGVLPSGNRWAELDGWIHGILHSNLN